MTNRLYSFVLLAILVYLPISTQQESARQVRSKMASMENLKKEQVVPDVIDTIPSKEIKVNYKTGVKVEQGNELTPTQVKDQPQFEYEAKSDELYTLAMVDPDALSRSEPQFREVLHFLVINIPGNAINKGNVLAEYIGSGPPKLTGLHRYVFLLYHQKDGKLESSMKIPKTSRSGRIKFSIRKFAKANNLGEPIAANFYQAQFDDYVPELHAQLSTG